MSEEIPRWRVWLMATRPATLTAALSPVMVGTAVAMRAPVMRWGAAVAAMLGAFMIQIGTNLANDVFDHEKGADNADRLGPLRVTNAGLMTPREVRRAMVFSFALAAVCGVYLTAVAGWPVVAIGVASIASGVAYTGGPYPLGYNGLGDVFVFVFFGVVAVCGTVFVEVGTVPWLALAAAVPVGAIATAVLVVNNVRDRETDVRAGKRTLVVRWGRTFGLAEYVGLLGAAYVVPVLLAALGMGWWVLLPLATAPLAAVLVRKVATLEGRALNPVLGQTAMLLLVFSTLFALGLTR